MKSAKPDKRQTINFITTLLASGLLALLLVSLFGKVIFPIKAFDFLVTLKPSLQGVTEIKIPPVGVMSAKTHLTPVKIQISLENVNFNVVHELIPQTEGTTSTQMVASIKKEIEKYAVSYILRLLLLALSGGALAALIINGKKIQPILWGMAVALFLAIILIGLTYLTYDAQKFRSPEFKGALKSAPWMIQMAEDVLQKYDLFGEQLEIIANNLYQLYDSINTQETMINSEDKTENYREVAVLLISDIHNNVAATRFLKQIAASFSIDFFIDLGDLTDYGTKLESLLLEELKDLHRPYLFVPGNHDSPEIIESLSHYSQVTMAQDQMVEFAGLNIFAFVDPLSGGKGIESLTSEECQVNQERIRQLWEETSPEPNLVAMHNLQYVSSLIGKVPLIVYGHTHQVSIREEKGTIIINPGSTGGAGIRGLQAVKEIPYSVVLLHFREKSDTQNDNKENLSLYAADIIKVYNLEKGFVLERKYFQ